MEGGLHLRPAQLLEGTGGAPPPCWPSAHRERSAWDRLCSHLRCGAVHMAALRTQDRSSSWHMLVSGVRRRNALVLSLSPSNESSSPLRL